MKTETQTRQKKSKKSAVTAVCALILAAGVMGLLLCAFAWYALSPVAPRGTSAVSIVIPQGASARAAAARLKDAGLIRFERVFYFYARFTNAELKAGSYSLSPSMGVKDILALLESGKSAYIAVSVPEGYTLNKIALLLEQKGVCPPDDFLAAARDEALLDEYEIPGDSFQGYLFPDTYFFVQNMGGERVIRMMADTFFQKLILIPAAKNLSPSSLYDVVTLASIVEREYRVESEAPLIASVFMNRIDQRWGLYSCATIEFIITEIQGKPHPDVITTEDTKIDNPYNTYRWAGLPPGPIASPGLIALNAAFSPADTNYYYFRVTDAAAGRHHFSSNFTEHVEIGREATKRAAGG